MSKLRVEEEIES